MTRVLPGLSPKYHSGMHRRTRITPAHAISHDSLPPVLAMNIGAALSGLGRRASVVVQRASMLEQIATSYKAWTVTCWLTIAGDQYFLSTFQTGRRSTGGGSIDTCCSDVERLPHMLPATRGEVELYSASLGLQAKCFQDGRAYSQLPRITCITRPRLDNRAYIVQSDHAAVGSAQCGYRP